MRQRVRRIATVLAVGPLMLSMATREADAQIRNRPLVVLIHGRDQMQKSNADLEKEWLPALKSGLARIGRAGLLQPGDAEMVFYQDIYRSDTAVCPADALVLEQRLTPLRASLAAARRESDEAAERAAFAQAAFRRTDQMSRAGLYSAEAVRDAEAQYRVASDVATAARSKAQSLEGAVQAETDRVAQEQAEADIAFAKNIPAKFKDKVFAFFSGLFGAQVAKSDIAMAALFPDTDRYITLRSFRCATNTRLSDALTKAKAAGRPLILVGHSMGTLVSYDTLFHDDIADQTLGLPPRYEVKAFVSLGSQLGVPPLVELFAGGFTKPPAPRSIGMWRNLRGDDDYVAPVYIEDHYEIPARSLYSEYSVRTIAGSPHNITGYLENEAVATTIASAWCAAFANDQTRPQACKGLQDLPRLAALPGGAKLRWPRQ